MPGVTCHLMKLKVKEQNPVPPIELATNREHGIRRIRSRRGRMRSGAAFRFLSVGTGLRSRMAAFAAAETVLPLLPLRLPLRLLLVLLLQPCYRATPTSAHPTTPCE